MFGPDELGNTAQKEGAETVEEEIELAKVGVHRTRALSGQL